MITLLSIREVDMNEGGFIIRSEVEGENGQSVMSAVYNPYNRCNLYN